MEHIITRRRGFRKLLAFLLCMASILGLLPAQAFAMSVGQTASSWLGDQYVGSDGNHYRAPAPYTYLAYHADGTIDVHTSSGGNAYRHYMLTDSDGISHQVYCVESGIPYHTSENTYVSESGTNSQYLNLLPAEARRGITLTAIYGWKPGAAPLFPESTRMTIRWQPRSSFGNTSSNLEAIRTAATETATQTPTSISA